MKKTPCTEPETKTGGEQYDLRRGDPCSGVVRRKKVVVVSSPPARRQKEKLEKVKQAAEAAARNAAPVPVKAVKTPPPVHYLRLLPPEQAIMTLKAFWPQLFDGNSPRLLATGMREQLFADIEPRPAAVA